MIDFRDIAKNLRKLLQDLPPYMAEHGHISLRVRGVLVDTEREMAVQSVLYLYDHLTFFEQWREAATLLAFALPHVVRNDPRIRPILEHAVDLANKIDDPSVELASKYLTGVHIFRSQWFDDIRAMPGRGLYWLSISRILRANVSIEYGTGCGTNIGQAAAAECATRWIGIDVSKAQIDANRETLAMREHPLTNASFEYDDDPAFFGVADCVGVLDTIEHTAFPDDLLAVAEKYCRPGGVVVVTAPNGPWSLHTPNDQYVGPGEHIGVETPETLAMKIQSRGRILDARILPGPIPAEGNSCVCITYEPGAK